MKITDLRDSKMFEPSSASKPAEATFVEKSMQDIQRKESVIQVRSTPNSAVPKRLKTRLTQTPNVFSSITSPTGNWTDFIGKVDYSLPKRP